MDDMMKKRQQGSLFSYFKPVGKVDGSPPLAKTKPAENGSKDQVGGNRRRVVRQSETYLSCVGGYS